VQSRKYRGFIAGRGKRKRVIHAESFVKASEATHRDSLETFNGTQRRNSSR